LGQRFGKEPRLHRGVASLGLGIGATAIFTLMDAVCGCCPADPEHLLVAGAQQGTDIGGFNYDDYKILRDASTMARSDTRLPRST
jgi:hypothetical protein